MVSLGWPSGRMWELQSVYGVAGACCAMRECALLYLGLPILMHSYACIYDTYYDNNGDGETCC